MLVLWALPTIVWLAVRRLSAEARQLCGMVVPAPRWWAVAAGVGALSLLIGAGIVSLLPDAAVAHSSTRIIGVASALSVAAAAIGEEIFFRGLLQGALARWRGPRFALWGQAVFFLLPHLALLLIDARLWPLLPAQFLMGVLLGVLRERSGSLWPAALAHVITNVGTGLLIAA
ncbi:CAAX protease self-immunity [Corynebacterium testudinoris]|uniref:CAAX protease self-immunity n=2 Tax=Corynebacterium testudinoris TaxID=136857 RepID=A0A0G3H6M7_9CORY|nr:CAAX protease self-immunity [Corynebacterium testudinoris]